MCVGTSCYVVCVCKGLVCRQVVCCMCVRVGEGGGVGAESVMVMGGINALRNGHQGTQIIIRLWGQVTIGWSISTIHNTSIKKKKKTRWSLDLEEGNRHIITEHPPLLFVKECCQISIVCMQTKRGVSALKPCLYQQPFFNPFPVQQLSLTPPPFQYTSIHLQF